MNSYFATVGENLINTLPTISDNSQTENHDDPPVLSITRTSSIVSSNRTVLEKINKLKTSKATGPDGISPKLKLAGKTIVPTLIIVSPEALFSLRGKQQDCHRFLKRMTRQSVAITDQSPC